jgi:hypothetical protein
MNNDTSLDPETARRMAAAEVAAEVARARLRHDAIAKWTAAVLAAVALAWLILR